MRGRQIKGPKDEAVRPISGRIKQSLFDILKARIAGTRFLDLFAGTGAVGIEALSRGADFVFFVDAKKSCVELIAKNLALTGMTARAKTGQGNILGDLSWIVFRSGVAQYDLIFMGPPYKDARKIALAYSTPTLEKIAAADILAPGGWIIGQHHVKEEVKPPAGYEMFRREKYGDTFVSFFRKL